MFVPLLRFTSASRKPHLQPHLKLQGALLLWTLVLGAAVAGLGGAAAAQGRGGPGGMGGMGGGMGRGGGMGNETRNLPAMTESRGGLQLGPPLRWWDNKDLAKHIGLDSNQTHRMDDVFSANRETLLKLYKGLQHEESQLQKMTRAKELDENQIFQQIDRVTQARGELEKATAHVVLLIRKEMTPEQTAKLDELQPQEAQ